MSKINARNAKAHYDIRFTALISNLQKSWQLIIIKQNWIASYYYNIFRISVFGLYAPACEGIKNMKPLSTVLRPSIHLKYIEFYTYSRNLQLLYQIQWLNCRFSLMKTSGNIWTWFWRCFRALPKYQMDFFIHCDSKFKKLTLKLPFLKTVSCKVDIALQLSKSLCNFEHSLNSVLRFFLSDLTVFQRSQLRFFPEIWVTFYFHNCSIWHFHLLEYKYKLLQKSFWLFYNFQVWLPSGCRLLLRNFMWMEKTNDFVNNQIFLLSSFICILYHCVIYIMISTMKMTSIRFLNLQAVFLL